MDQYLKLLGEFHIAIGDKPVAFIAGNKTARLRARLIAEEGNEVCDELESIPEDTSEEALLKELCDVLYVVFGTAWAYDLPIWEAFKEVHKNNMLKVGYPKDQYGKTIKPKDHPKVNLKKIIERYRDDGA
jgi:hypothetical protein